MGTRIWSDAGGWGRTVRTALVVVLASGAVACEDSTGVDPVAVATVEVGPNGRVVSVGDTVRFTATARATDGTPVSVSQFQWITGDDDVATIVGQGASALVTAKGTGNVLVTARVGSRVGSTYLGVAQAPPVAVTIRITPGASTLSVGERVTLEGTLRDADDEIVSGPPISWTSGSPSVAVVEAGGAPGQIVVHALKAGTVTITARSGALENGVQLTISDLTTVSALEMRPAAMTVETGTTQTLGVHAWGPDGGWLENATLTWTSLDTSVVKVTGTGRSGRVVGVRDGVARVRVAGAGVAVEATVTVRRADGVDRVIVNPGTPTAWAGSLVRFTAHVLAPGGHIYVGYPVAWSVADTTIATIEADGLVHARRVGTTRVFARSGGKQGELTLRVYPTPTGRIAFDLAPTEGPWGEWRPLVSLGDTLWTSPAGTTHTASRFLIGGTMEIDMVASTWTQTLRVELLVDFGAGPMRAAVQERSDQGTLTWGVLQGWQVFLRSTRQPGATFEGTMIQAGRLGLQQTLGGTSVRDYLWILR